MSEERLLQPEMIPESLWLPEFSTLVLPAPLCQVYKDLVNENGLWDAATKVAQKGPIGGASKEETDKHFAHSFDGSAARTLLAILDPKNEVGLTSNTFIKCTAGTSLSLTDAPCGAGAAAAVFLSALAELRREKVLPREPLSVRLLGAELSPHAIDYARSMLERLVPSLEDQAIFLELDFMEWDVTCEESTAQLVSSCEKACGSVERRLLLVANFSGFVNNSKNWAVAEPHLYNLMSSASNENSFAVWIEPPMKVASGGNIFSWLFKLCSGAWNFLRPRVIVPDIHYSAQARFQLPLQPDITARVHLSVIPFKVGGWI